MHYEPREPVGEDEARRFADERARLQKQLHVRTLAAELALEIQRARAQRQRREVEVAPEIEAEAE